MTMTLSSMIGTGTLLGSGTTIANTQVLAKTDGFAVVQVGNPEDNSKMSYAYGYIFTIKRWFVINGGTVGSFGKNWQDYMNINPNSCCIPIPANTYWQYHAANPPNNQKDSVINIYWFPLSASSAGESTYEIIPENEADLVPPPPMPDINEITNRRQAGAADFITKLEKAFDKPIEAGAKSELAELLAAF